MRKPIAILLCLVLLASLLGGCSAAPTTEATAAPEQTEPLPTDAEPVTEEPEPVPTESVPGEPEPAPAEPTPEEPEPTPVQGHYTFQPKVCSSYMRELFGETMVETWYNLVDAVMAGEDTFACPDAHTYDWVMGQFPDKCFPVLVELIDYCYDRGNPVTDGVASFTYLVPPEEAAARIADFAALVEGILNETLADDYTDLEKALALYIYFSPHYIYDYEAARPDIYVDYLSGYRVLTTGTGICQEFSVAYSYLLLQAGVDASTMSGHRSYDRAPHQWSYVKINGHDFHIDPTYVIGDYDSLSYFMMTDEQREAADSYPRSEYTICSNYAQDHPHADYSADDDSFRPIWAGSFRGFDHETRTLLYEVYEDGGSTIQSFDYSGW